MNFSISEGITNDTDCDTGDNRDYWTRWFNSDKPWDNDGDYETVERVQTVYGQICEKGYDLCAAQCRVEGTGVIFDKNTILANDSDVLQRYCTTEGLICNNSIQSLRGHQCQDYSIQFRCHYTGDIISSISTYSAHFDIRIYIILALVPLVLLVARMWWVYVYRRRQQIRRHESNEGVDTSSSFSSSLTKPPPTYRELFGKAGNHKCGSQVFTISRENIPICSTCQTEPCSVALIIGNNKPSEISEASKKVVSNSTNRVTIKKEVEQPMNTLPGAAVRCTSNINSRGSPTNVLLSHTETNTCTHLTQPAEASIEINLNQASSTPDFALNKHLSKGSDTVHFENELSGIAKSCELLQPLSSKTALVKSTTVSHPCACPCHRTIPLKQPKESDCNSSNCSYETNDSGIGKVYGHNRIWLDMSSHCQSELPSYKDALDIIKRTETDQNSL